MYHSEKTDDKSITQIETSHSGSQRDKTEINYFCHMKFILDNINL